MRTIFKVLAAIALVGVSNLASYHLGVFKAQVYAPTQDFYVSVGQGVVQWCLDKAINFEQEVCQ